MHKWSEVVIERLYHMQKRNDTKIIYEIKKLTNQLLSAINVTVFFFFLFSIFDFTIVAICFCYKAH